MDQIILEIVIWHNFFLYCIVFFLYVYIDMIFSITRLTFFSQSRLRTVFMRVWSVPPLQDHVKSCYVQCEHGHSLWLFMYTQLQRHRVVSFDNSFPLEKRILDLKSVTLVKEITFDGIMWEKWLGRHPKAERTRDYNILGKEALWSCFKRN